MRLTRFRRLALPRLPTLVAALTLAFAASAQAQSLKQLYEVARGYDAALLAARAQADSIRYRLAQAESLNKPLVTLSSSATVGAVDAPRVDLGDSNAVLGRAAGRYPLFNKTNNVTIAQARKVFESTESDLALAEQDLMVRVTQAYFDVLAAQDALATTRGSKAAITEQLASAKRNFEVGTATITDTREAQARFDLATAQEIAADNDLRAKRIALDQLVGKPGTEPKGLSVPVNLPPVLPPDVNAWVSSADSEHPAIRKARFGLDVAALEVDKSRAALAPTVDALGAVTVTRNSGGASLSNGITKSASVGVELNYTLYNGGLTQGRISETQSLEEKARNDLEASRRAVAQNTRVAYFGVQSGLAQVKALEAAESSTKLALEATQLGYRVGVRVNLDVLNAQSQLYTTQRDLAKARYDVLVGSLRLRQASGQLRPQDIDAVNALLAP